MVDWTKCYRRLKNAKDEKILSKRKLYDTLKILIENILIKIKKTNKIKISELHASTPNLSLLTDITSTIEAACCFMLIATTDNLNKLL